MVQPRTCSQLAKQWKDSRVGYKNPVVKVGQSKNMKHVMLAAHSRRVHLARVSGESCQSWDWASETLYTLAKSFQFWHATRGETQNPLTRAHEPLKKRDLNEARHERRSYTRRSKASVPIYTLALALSRSFLGESVQPALQCIKHSQIQCQSVKNLSKQEVVIYLIDFIVRIFALVF